MMGGRSAMLKRLPEARTAREAGAQSIGDLARLRQEREEHQPV